MPPKGEAVLPKAGAEAPPKTDEDDAAAPNAGWDVAAPKPEPPKSGVVVCPKGLAAAPKADPGVDGAPKADPGVAGVAKGFAACPVAPKGEAAGEAPKGFAMAAPLLSVKTRWQSGSAQKHKDSVLLRLPVHESC